MDASSKDPLNPKDLIGAAKLPLHLWPATATAMGCLGLLEGMSKYGRSNWRAAGVRASIYVDACKRHLDAWFEGEELSPEGVPHLANALACLAILVDAEAHGKLHKDRQFAPTAGYRNLVTRLTPLVNQIKMEYKDKSPKHWDETDGRPAQGVGRQKLSPQTEPVDMKVLCLVLENGHEAHLSGPLATQMYEALYRADASSEPVIVKYLGHAVVRSFWE